MHVKNMLILVKNKNTKLDYNSPTELELDYRKVSKFDIYKIRKCS